MQVYWKEYHHIDIKPERHAHIVQMIKGKENYITQILSNIFRNEQLPRGEFNKLVNHFSRALQNRTSDSISLHWTTNHVTAVDEQSIINLALPQFLKFCDECADDYMQLWQGNFILQDVIKKHIHAPYYIHSQFFTPDLRAQFYDQLIQLKPDVEFTKEEFITI